MRNLKFGMLVLFLSALFFYFRIPSLLSHYVAYTYDQGRDFIAGSSIVINRDLPFIGPTTGIQGLFHGAWWYYVLTIPYLIFQGEPIGYYWFNCVVQYIAFLALVLYIKKTYGLTVSALFGVIIAAAPYFTFMSLFVGNNSMVLPSLVTFLIANHILFHTEKPSPVVYVVLGVSLGFVAEFELSFGILLIPLYVSAVLLFSKLRNALFSKKGIGFAIGLFFAFAPRLLFEIKNSFAQTKILLSFFIEPKLYNQPSPYLSRLSERMILFREYYYELFSNQTVAHIFFFFIVVFLMFALQNSIKKRSKLDTSLLFFSYIFFGLFFLSTLYKDFFWKNYYEGIHYLLLFIMVLIIGQHAQKTIITLKRVALFTLLFIVFISTGLDIYRSYNSHIPFDGLQVQEKIVAHILEKNLKNKNFCVRVYTPSVIPHTYNYLWQVNNLTPSTEWINGTCWFIVEADSFAQRRQDWLNTHMPKDKHTKTVTKIKDVEVQYYEVYQ